MRLPPPVQIRLALGPAALLYDSRELFDLNDEDEREWQEECETFFDEPMDMADSDCDMVNRDTSQSTNDQALTHPHGHCDSTETVTTIAP